MAELKPVAVITGASRGIGRVIESFLRQTHVDKHLLIFDEATSSLDNVTQAVVTQSLSRLAVSRIVIAHRLTTVRQADRIYVFDSESFGMDNPAIQSAARQ